MEEPCNLGDILVITWIVRMIAPILTQREIAEIEIDHSKGRLVSVILVEVVNPLSGILQYQRESTCYLQPALVDG